MESFNVHLMLGSTERKSLLLIAKAWMRVHISAISPTKSAIVSKFYLPWLTAARTSSEASLFNAGSPAKSAIVSKCSRGTCKISATSCCFSARACLISSSFLRSLSVEEK